MPVPAVLRAIDVAAKFNEPVIVRRRRPGDQLEGGLADSSSRYEFDEQQVRMGIQVEYEHTNDHAKAMEIAMDHLREDPEYYTKLKQIHVEQESATEPVPVASSPQQASVPETQPAESPAPAASPQGTPSAS